MRIRITTHKIVAALGLLLCLISYGFYFLRHGIPPYEGDATDAGPENEGPEDADRVNLPYIFDLDPEHLRGELPVLAITIDEQFLSDPDIGLIAGDNVFLRGRSWERPAHISYYEQGERLLGTGVGLRIHGGNMRRGKTKRHFFRLVFRKTYGAKKCIPDILFDKQSDPIRRLVLRGGIIDQDKKPNVGGFRNSLAFDIARQIGCIVPQTKLVDVFINENPYGQYDISEHLDKHYLKSHYGHDKFLFYNDRATMDKGGEALARIVRGWLEESDGQWTMEEAGKHIDIENLSRWFISILFCATSDAYQGMTVLDETEPLSKLFFINWDMDHSFIYRDSAPAWSIDTIHEMETDDGSGKLKRDLLRDLMKDPEFRKYFEKLLMDTLNHKLAPAFLESKLQYYENIFISNGVKLGRLSKRVRAFFPLRKEFLRSMMQTHMNSEESYSCTVKGPVDHEYEIDGFPHKGTYDGWYFKGSTIRLGVESSHRESFSHWLINGRTIKSEIDLVYQVNSKTTLQFVPKKRPHQ